MDSKRNWKHICCSVLRILLCMILLYGCQTAVKTESTPIAAVETEPAFEESAPSEAPVLAEPDRIRTVYEPETAYSCPPTVIQKVETVAQFEALASVPTPQGAWFILNDAGNAICLQEKEVPLHEVFAKCYGTIIPVFELPSASAAESLQAFTKASRTMDFLVAAETAEILRSVSAVGVGKVLITDRVTESTSQEVWRAGATAVVVPQITADEAADLQLHWIAVLLQPPLAAEDAVRAALQCGADMVVTTDARAAYRVYSSAAPESSVVRKTFIVAHRGVHDHAPENTLASFTEAVKAGADAVECDVYITKDGHAVICHNETVGMYVTDGTDARVEDLTRAELKALPLKAEEAYANERFAFLDEFMDAMQGNDVHLVVEIKTDNPDCVGLIRKLAEERNLKSRISIISFLPEQIAAAREQLPEVPASLLANVGKSEPDKYLQSFYRNTVGQLVGYSPSTSFTPEGVAAFRHRGILINLWTIDGKDAMRGAQQAGVATLTTNTVGEKTALAEPSRR